MPSDDATHAVQALPLKQYRGILLTRAGRIVKAYAEDQERNQCGKEGQQQVPPG
jgi:hypothetical protein